MLIAQVDITLVIVTFLNCGTAIAIAWIVHGVRRDIKTPSGDTLGKVAERTHDLSAADVAISQHVLATALGDGEEAARIVHEAMGNDSPSDHLTE